MIEKFPEKEKTKTDLLSEEEYIEECVAYALGGGWVKKEEKNIFINKYLKPIYQKYLEVIGEVRSEIRTEELSGVTIEEVIKRLNVIMERTKRIGSTDPGNIIRSINDFYRFNCRRDDYSEYAASALSQFIAEIINQ